MAVEKGQLVATFVEPGELPPRVHQPQQELPRLAPFSSDLHHHFEKIDLGFARTMNQRHVDLGSLAASLAQVLMNHGQADLVSFFT